MSYLEWKAHLFNSDFWNKTLINDFKIITKPNDFLPSITIITFIKKNFYHENILQFRNLNENTITCTKKTGNDPIDKLLPMGTGVALNARKLSGDVFPYQVNYIFFIWL